MHQKQILRPNWSLRKISSIWYLNRIRAGNVWQDLFLWVYWSYFNRSFYCFAMWLIFDVTMWKISRLPVWHFVCAHLCYIEVFNAWCNHLYYCWLIEDVSMEKFVLQIKNYIPWMKDIMDGTFWLMTIKFVLNCWKMYP